METEVGNSNEHIDRTLLKEQRKLRKKLKKEEKRAEKILNHEQSVLRLKMGPRDQHVTIISKELANSIVNIPTNKQLCHYKISEQDFPQLGVKTKPKLPPIECNDKRDVEKTVQTLQNTKSMRNSAIKVDLVEILTRPDYELHAPTKEKKTVKLYSGNMLDSSMPERKKGKHREVPKKKKPNTFKTIILREEIIEPNVYDSIHSANFEIYCDNCIDKALNEIVEFFLSEIVRFQEKLFNRDPLKGATKKRYICGFREVKKFLIVKKIRIVVIAPNIKVASKNGIIYKTIEELKSLATTNDIPYIFALHKRKLGKITLKHIPISCIGITDYSGAEEAYKKIMSILPAVRQEFKDLKSDNKSQNNCTTELSNKFIDALQ